MEIQIQRVKFNKKSYKLGGGTLEVFQILTGEKDSEATFKIEPGTLDYEIAARRFNLDIDSNFEIFWLDQNIDIRFILDLRKKGIIDSSSHIVMFTNQ